MKFLIDKLPETANAFADMRVSLFKDSALDTKTKELIAVSSSVLMRCEKCVEIHASRARDNGQQRMRSLKQLQSRCLLPVVRNCTGPGNTTRYLKV
jgi:AhpD family alkylhydroperoxidase